VDRLRDDGLDPDRHTLIEIATIITDFDLNIIDRGPDLAIKLSPRQSQDDGPVVAAHPHGQRPARALQDGRRRDGGRREEDAGVHQEVLRRQDRAAVRQSRVAGQAVHLPVHARDRALPALPDRRRQFDQADDAALVPESESAGQAGNASRARSISRSRSPSCGSTAP
jgi:hypothetical protein